MTKVPGPAPAVNIATAGVGAARSAIPTMGVASYGAVHGGVAGADIGINNALFETKLAAFETAGKEIETATSLRDPTVCRGLVLSDWVDLCCDISILLILYKELITKDAQSIRDSQKALNDADKYRADNIK